MSYCNITTDLTDLSLYAEQYQGKRIIEGWTLVSGQTKTYYHYATGQVNQVFQDGTPLTVRASIALVEANASSWYYDATIDILYIQTSASLDPDGSCVIEIGEDWDGFKTTMRNSAEEEMDGYLKSKYHVPLLPRIRKIHSTGDYESIVKNIAAALTCRNIIRRVNPADPKARQVEKIALNSEPETGEEKGLINKLMDGDIALQDQIVANEVTGWKGPYPYASNTATAYIWLWGQYTGDAQEYWQLKIDTAGGVGTATWKLSKNGGSTYSPVLQSTLVSGAQDRLVYLGDGIYVLFYGTFGVGDYWDFEVIPGSYEPDVSVIGSVEMVNKTDYDSGWGRKLR
jgi:hypothetical protein